MLKKYIKKLYAHFCFSLFLQTKYILCCCNYSSCPSSWFFSIREPALQKVESCIDSVSTIICLSASRLKGNTHTHTRAFFLSLLLRLSLFGPLFFFQGNTEVDFAESGRGGYNDKLHTHTHTHAYAWVCLSWFYQYIISRYIGPGNNINLSFPATEIMRSLPPV